MPSDSPPVSKLRKFFHSSGSTEHSINLASLKENAKSAWHGFKLASKNMEKFLDGTPLKIPVGVINALIALVDAVIDNHDSMAILLLPIGQRLHIVSASLEKKRRPRGIDSTCKRFIHVLTDTVKELEDIKEQGLFKRVIEAGEQPKQLKDIFRRVDEATKNFELELTLATVREVEGIVQNTEILRLENLRPSHQARYAAVMREPCIKGTREAIIESVLSWSRDPDSPPIFWLSGMAGTGKSTISYTICQKLYDGGNASQRLGASFFCSRQIEARRLRRNVIPTITYDLAHSFPPFGRALLTSKFDAQPPPLGGHIRSLLSDPWRSVSANQNLPPMVVIIDALDELEKGEGTDFLEELMKEIAQHQEGFRGLKFFVTSRQDPHIVNICASIPPNAVYRLETADAAVVEQDITLYLRTKLPTLEELQVKILAKNASGLFIYAATVVRFVVPKPRAKPDVKRVKMLLEAWPDQSQRGASRLLIDQLYEEILIEWISSNDMSVVDQELAFSILQTVMLTEEPVLISDIPQLMKECDVQVEKVEDVIRSLHAVLFVSDHHIHSFHKSFADFMLDHTRLTKQELTSIIPPPSHRQVCLTTACFRLMESLRFNICDLPSSFLDDSEVEGLQERVKDRISTALRYACRHWATHFSKTSHDNRKQMMGMFMAWQEQRLLFWMEAMNLIKVVGECYPILVKARQSLGTTIRMNYRRYIMTGESLATAFGGNITSKSTPHLYISSLATSSRDSGLMSGWHHRFPNIPRVIIQSSGGRSLLILSQESEVQSVAFSPNGTHIMSVLGSGTLRMLDTATGEQLFNLWDNCQCASLSPDGAQIVSGSVHSVAVCASSTGTQLHQLDIKNTTAISFSSGSTHIVFGTLDGSVLVWDASTWKQLYQLDGHEGEVKSVCFSPDGTRIISGSGDGILRVWDTSATKQLYDMQLDEDSQVHSVNFSPDGTRIISGSSYQIDIWDASTGNKLHRLVAIGRGHKNRVNSVKLSPNGSLIVSANNVAFNIWDATTGKLLHEQYGHEWVVTSVGFSPDGTRIVSGSEDQTIRIWDVSTLAEKELYHPTGHKDMVRSVNFSSDGKYITSGTLDGIVCIWDASTGKRLFEREACIMDGGVHSVNFSPDGRHIVSGSANGEVNIWDVSSGELHTGWELEHKVGVNSVSFSPEGTHILCGAYLTVYIWDLSTGEQSHTMLGHKAEVTSTSFSSDGKLVVSGSYDHTVRIWDASTGMELNQLNGHVKGVSSVGFSRDGTHIVSGSLDKTIRIWDTSTWTEIRELTMYGAVSSVSFSPDATRIVYSENVLGIWDLSAMKPYQLIGHDSSAPVTSVSFSPDGTHVVSGSEDGTIQVWDISRGLSLLGQPHYKKNPCIDVPPLTEAKGDMFSLNGALMYNSSKDTGMHWRVHPDTGWIASSDGERYLWLSPEMHKCLQRPDCLVISGKGSIDIDLRTGRFGEDWASCYDPNGYGVSAVIS